MSEKEIENSKQQAFGLFFGDKLDFSIRNRHIFRQIYNLVHFTTVLSLTFWTDTFYERTRDNIRL